MAFGMTTVGFVRKTFAEAFSVVTTRLKQTIDSRLVLDETTPLGNVTTTLLDQVAELWELAEEAYYAFDPDNAVGQQMVSLAALTGTYRRAATVGTVYATVNLAPNRDYAPGTLVAHEDSNPENRWYNLNAVSSTTAGNYEAIFVSELTGTSARVAATKLNTIAEAVTGWYSVTNAADAIPGEAQESIEELRARRERELQQAGSATLGAVVAAVSRIPSVLDCTGFENLTNETVDGIGPHGIRIVLWDGNPPAVSNNLIAQAIYDERAAGIQSYGTSSGVAATWDGGTLTQPFDRATQKIVELRCTIDSEDGVTITNVKAAILAVFGGITIAEADIAVEDDAPVHKPIGLNVRYNSLVSSVFAVKGVRDVSSFQIRYTGGSWGTANLDVLDDEIATLTASDITVTGDVS